MSKKQIEEHVEATMNSLEGLQSAIANPFLVTRIEQRLANKYSVETYGKKMFGLAIAILLFIVLNVFSYEKIANSKSAVNTSANGIEAFASDYGLTDNSTNIN